MSEPKRGLQPPSLDRRSALGLAAVGLLASGCTLHGSLPSGPATEPVARDADLPAARAAIALTEDAIATVVATTSAHHRLGHDLAPILAMHRAHLGRLRSISTARRTPHTIPPHVPGRADRALEAVWAGERVRRTQLEKLAQNAHSGAFARLLAAMAAAVGQRTGGQR